MSAKLWCKAPGWVLLFQKLRKLTGIIEGDACVTPAVSQMKTLQPRGTQPGSHDQHPDGGFVLSLGNLTTDPVHRPLHYTEKITGCERTISYFNNMEEQVLEFQAKFQKPQWWLGFTQDQDEEGLRTDQRGRGMLR